jgi:hypothetical protein
MKSKTALAIAVALTGLLGLEMIGMAEMPLPSTVIVQMKSGKITAVGKDEIQIDGYTYRISPKAEIIDQGGDRLSVEEIRPTGLVKYNLKAGEIESMIVTNPQ